MHLPTPIPGLTPGPLPLTWAPIAFGGVAAPQEVEGVVVVEASGAWAARKVATASGVALIPWTLCGGRGGGQIVDEGLRLDLPMVAVLCPSSASSFIIGPSFYWEKPYI